MADDPQEARRILLDFISAIRQHEPHCSGYTPLDVSTGVNCTHSRDLQEARSALDALELQHLDELAPK